MVERKGGFSTLLPILDESEFALNNYEGATTQASESKIKDNEEFNLRTTGHIYEKARNREFLPEPTRPGFQASCLRI